MSEQIAEPMSDNEALRRILANVEGVEQALRGVEYDSVQGSSYTTSSGDEFTVPADELSVKAVVVNRGPESVEISEGGALVAILGAGQTWVSPLSGKESIRVTSVESCSIHFARYLRAA